MEKVLKNLDENQKGSSTNHQKIFIFLNILAYYMVGSMAVTALSLIATVVIVNVFYHDPTRRVPDWLRKSVLDVLARATCFTSGRKSNQTEVHVKEIPENVSVSQGKEEMGAYKDQDIKPQHVAYPKSRERQIEEYKIEWQRVSKIIDRFCLLITCFAAFVLFIFLVIAINS